MNNVDIHVQHSGFVPRIRVSEGARGSLFAIEDKQLPFSFKRIYALCGVADDTLTRGNHAHKTNDQVMFVIQGALTLHLDDGTSTQSLRITNDDPGVRLGVKLWHSMNEFTQDCVAIIVASHAYDDSDYIRDYSEFKKYVSTI